MRAGSGEKSRGFILVIGVVVLTSLLLLALPFIYQLMSERKISEKSYKVLTAMSMAEAGAERAIWELAYGDISSWSGNSSLRTKTISDFQAAGGAVLGDIEISVSDPESNSPVVEATGRVPYSGSTTVDRTVKVVLEREALFSYAAFGVERVTVQEEALVDSYDSRDGPYGDLNISFKGNVGTNDTRNNRISIVGTSVVMGNAYSGPGSDPELAIQVDESATLSGSKEALQKAKTIVSVLPPEGLPQRGNYNLSPGGFDTISSSGEYSSFTLEDNASLTITANVTLFVNGNFTMKSSSQLDIPDGVTVFIYLASKFKQYPGSSVNNLSQDPTRLIILGTQTCTDFDFKNGSAFYGAVYVPAAPLDIGETADVYGSMVGKRVTVKSSASLHYDEALQEVIVPSIELNSYVVKSWRKHS